MSPGLTIRHIGTNEVQDEITKLKAKLSVRIDTIPNFVVKRRHNVFAPALCHMSSLALASGVFPSPWKRSVVKPMHKNGDTFKRLSTSVSLLCAFPKVFEIIIHSRVSYYFRHKVQQCPTWVFEGTIGGKKIVVHILIIQFLQFIIEGKQISCILDMTKAFDNVNQDVLLYKLSLHGCSQKVSKLVSDLLDSSSKQRQDIEPLL